MIDTLPVEILREILKPLFHVNSEDFRLVGFDLHSESLHFELQRP